MIDLQQSHQHLAKLTASQRVRWALEHLPENAILSTSFGIQSAVLLHMVTQIRPNIPVVFTDTGYLFEETYQFADELTQRLGLNLHVYQSDLSPAWQETRFGKLWESGSEGMKRYNELNKLEPMKRAIEELDCQVWFSGIRADQSEVRQRKTYIEKSTLNGRTHSHFKVYPILDWSNRKVHEYLTEYDLPYHPLWHEGYVSLGDKHSTKKLTLGMTEEETRNNGLFRECGLHEENTGGF